MKKHPKALTPENWFDTAFNILTAEGHQSITLRDMCAKLSVSTGSFYHHFANRDDFVERLFDYWAERGRASLGELVENGTVALNDINRHVNALIDHRLEAAMRAWGLFDERVAQKIGQLDESRRKFFKTYYAGRVDPAKMRDLINLHLCSLVGAQFMYLDKPKTLNRFGAFVNQTAETLIDP